MNTATQSKANILNGNECFFNDFSRKITSHESRLCMLEKEQIEKHQSLIEPLANLFEDNKIEKKSTIINTTNLSNSFSANYEKPRNIASLQKALKSQ